MVPSCRNPIENVRGAPGFELHADPDRRIHRTLSYGIALKRSVLGISPGALGAAEFLGAGGPLIETIQRIGLAAGKEVTIAFVVDDGGSGGVVIGRVSNGALRDVEVLVKENAHVARPVGEVVHDQRAEE